MAGEMTMSFSGAALVFFLFLKLEEERKLLMEFHAEDLQHKE